RSSHSDQCVRMKTAVKSSITGVVASATDLLCLTLLVEVAGVGERIANVPALAAGMVVQFLGNKYFAFEDSSSSFAKQGALFALVEAAAMFLNGFFFDRIAALEALPYPVLRLLVQAFVYFGFSLPLWSRIFQKKE